VRLIAWLGSRTPAPSPELGGRIAELAAPFDAAPGGVADRCLLAAERALQRLLAGSAATRDAALDLLAIDALVTYAFESASDEPHRIIDLARDAMIRLSTVAPAV
jgi:hypothetical protein